MSRVVEYVALAAAILTVAGCGDGDVAASVKSGWKGIDSRHYVVMDDVSLLKRWVEIDCTGGIKKDVEAKGGIEVMLAKAGGKIEEKGRKCFANLVFLNDALEGMGASHSVVTAVVDKASHAYSLKWEMSLDDVAASLSGVAELYGMLAGINAPPADMAECLVKEYIDRPADRRGDVIAGVRQKAEKYQIVKDVLVSSGISRKDAEAGLALFVFEHGSGLDKSKFWENEKTFAKIECKDLKSLVPDCKRLLKAFSAVKETAGRNLSEPLINYMATPAGERGKALMQIETFAKTFAKNRKEMGDFAAALQARELAERPVCHPAFCDVMTSVGIPEDVVMSELDRSVFRDHDYSALMDVGESALRDVKTLKKVCGRMRKALSSGKVPDERIVRYLAHYLLSSPEDRRKMEGDCPVFVEMYGVVADFVKETVSEAGKARTIFTDGAFDEEIRAEVKRRGLSLVPRSMMKAGDAPVETFIDEMTNGMAVAQLGAERIGRIGASQSVVYSGVLFRCGKTSAPAFRNGAVEAEKLAERILALQKRKVVDALMDEEMKNQFLKVQWRIARIARARSDQERVLGQNRQAKRSLAIADKLDECNSALKHLADAMSEARAKKNGITSLRDNLHKALCKADFETAQAFAKTVLETQPTDMDANFAMGMWHIQHERWRDAESYFLRCKEKQPSEPAIWNNLAMVYLRQRKLDEAMRHARHALSLAPDSAEIKDTIKQIEKAMAK